MSFAHSVLSTFARQDSSTQAAVFMISQYASSRRLFLRRYTKRWNSPANSDMKNAAQRARCSHLCEAWTPLSAVLERPGSHRCVQINGSSMTCVVRLACHPAAGACARTLMPMT